MPCSRASCLILIAADSPEGPPPTTTTSTSSTNLSEFNLAFASSSREAAVAEEKRRRQLDCPNDDDRKEAALELRPLECENLEINLRAERERFAVGRKPLLIMIMRHGWVVNRFCKEDMAGCRLSPYVDVLSYPLVSLVDMERKTGIRNYHLAFIVANEDGRASWGNQIPISDRYYTGEITKLRAKGGEVTISFGGALGVELACHAANSHPRTLYQKYLEVVEMYRLKRIDLDIEGNSLSNRNANANRNAALKLLKEQHPLLEISFTLPVSLSGLTREVLDMLSNAVEIGLDISIVNVMGMNFYSPNGMTVAQKCISAIMASFKQLTSIGLNAAKIGLTVMIGQTDCRDEVFTLEDARQICLFCTKNRSNCIAMLSYWSMNRDRDNLDGPLYLSSQIKQKDLEFASIFAAFEK